MSGDVLLNASSSVSENWKAHMSNSPDDSGYLSDEEICSEAKLDCSGFLLEEDNLSEKVTLNGYLSDQDQGDHCQENHDDKLVKPELGHINFGDQMADIEIFKSRASSPKRIDHEAALKIPVFELEVSEDSADPSSEDLEEGIITPSPWIYPPERELQMKTDLNEIQRKVVVEEEDHLPSLNHDDHYSPFYDAVTTVNKSLDFSLLPPDLTAPKIPSKQSQEFLTSEPADKQWYPPLLSWIGPSEQEEVKANIPETENLSSQEVKLLDKLWYPPLLSSQEVKLLEDKIANLEKEKRENPLLQFQNFVDFGSKLSIDIFEKFGLNVVHLKNSSFFKKSIAKKLGVNLVRAHRGTNLQPGIFIESVPEDLSGSLVPGDEILQINNKFLG